MDDRYNAVLPEPIQGHQRCSKGLSHFQREQGRHKLYVGIDWASDHHNVCLTNDSAQNLAAFQIAHGSEGWLPS